MTLDEGDAPSVPVIMEWTLAAMEQDHPVALVLPGPSHAERQRVLRQYTEGIQRASPVGVVINADEGLTASWVQVGTTENFFGRVASMRMPALLPDVLAGWYSSKVGEPWELLWGLIAVEEFLVDEPLRSMVDQSFYLVHDVHRAIWEARFLAREHAALDVTERFVQAITSWISGQTLSEEHRQALSSIGINRPVATATEQLDVMFFLLSLAYHSGLIERAVFVFDDLEEALQPQKRAMLRQIRDLLATAKRWALLGSPVGILLGFSGSRQDMELLSKYNMSLAVEVSSGLDWTRQSVA